jgi:hypothetical protein
VGQPEILLFLRRQPSLATAPIAASAGTAELRRLSLMFCDLGSTELSARLDLEDLNRLIRASEGSHLLLGRDRGARAIGGEPLAHRRPLRPGPCHSVRNAQRP